MDRIKEIEVKGPNSPELPDLGDNFDDGYDNFDDYPSDLPLNFEEHPFIRDEMDYGDEDVYSLEVEG